jgi:transcriptional regulator with XRE-family HTH domain
MQHGEKLRRLRLGLGLSFNEMARAIGLIGEGAADKVRAMEREAREISGPIFELMRYIEKYGLIDDKKNERLENDD